MKTICATHEEIRDAANDIDRAIENLIEHFSNVPETPAAVMEEAQKILLASRSIHHSVDSAKTMGIAMEERLKRYYFAITSLGFVRHKPEDVEPIHMLDECNTQCAD